MGQAMGSIKGNLKNAQNIQEANLSDLDNRELAQRAFMGGMRGLANVGQQRIQGGGAAPIGIAPPPIVPLGAFSPTPTNSMYEQEGGFDPGMSVKKRNPFYGGY